ncbi:invasin domain 3-containing protein [Archangium sp.]|uniref:invasin domain 3-containing protein n=1 Tax=Archangium sp. TaxID=1872627 RepID=UPI002D3E4A6F|nr:invasin domain 3-containing protein [Archangium sp.]HYO57129.1 invasin domain 3-containing protein [Archangium sp.]
MAVTPQVGRGAGWLLGPLVLLCLLGTGSTRAAPPLRLEASPRQLLSGRDTRSTLTVSAPGLPSDVRLACSAGRILPARRSAPDTLQAAFVPPRTDTLAPILCAAVSPSSGAHATVVLEVQRRQVLSLSELPPLGRVEVHIGDALYGPIRANATGQAEVPVLLTPTLAQATVSATAPGQPTRQRLLPLPVSSRPEVLLLAEESSVEADGVHGVRVWAFGIDGRGEPLEAAPTFSRTGGTFEPQRVAPGIHVGTFLPHPRAAPGEAALTAQAGNGEPSSIGVELRAGVKPVLTVEAVSRELLADGASGTDVTVSVRDERGRGLPGQPVRLQASRGEVAPLQDRGDGTYLARYRAPTGGGEEQLVARLDGAPPASLALTLRPPPRLTLETSAHELPADGVARLVLLLSARDAKGLLAPDGTEISLTTTLGLLPTSVRTREGRATVELVSGHQAGEALVQARWEDASASTSVRLIPGTPARLRVRAEEREVRCDGRDSVQVHLLVQDAHGNPLDGVPITLSAAGTQAEHGRFERVAALGGGEFITRFHAPSRCEGGVATVLAAAGEARGETRLTLATRTPRGLTLRLGAQSNLGRLVQPSLELEGDVRPYALGERLAASASVQVAWGRFSLRGESAAHEPFDLTGQALTTTVSVGARWLVPLPGSLSAHAGAGLDAHLVHIDWRLSLDPGGQRQVSPAFGGHIRLGLTYPLGPGELVLQGRYGLARLPEGGTFQGPIGGLSTSLGYRFPL